ncbi:MAG: dTDP-4-dehydrorhamnose 3,5-epimerase [Candidatus Fluviicola riflensis]|nr:MAG: dTDP-4-dehydrorhamnose 3,5-epimerase [Candidatus Fluviicola riflensis]OGS76590.1 MAG: dTDP-4-dehydrorhamnose 3,5-epimerase [Candidatus Fluviicola riflensis]OGS83055.1 MAG: dTDP-4-dehydrorhamnose 3,5-epimerase [Fluviicola sp. RIFCSPHIGHO2_01_FULL_43_53]OGS88321.1 MAG: dTDP-4-dehydrorhamnose 3,5-epimerase [Fluviicola sp. RIFCSPHIGHO2_12_FULL_43_24]
MVIEQTHLEGVLLFSPRIFSDNRGHFFESFNHRDFESAVGFPVEFVQDNESVSHRNVLRGLHFQLPPMSQGKLVRVVQGSVLDVAVDLRKNSSTFGKHVAVQLSSENKKQLWIPPGFAHGFLSLEEGTIFSYKCTNYYAPETECTLQWNDPELGINWGIEKPVISAKDQNSLLFHTFTTPF